MSKKMTAEQLQEILESKLQEFEIIVRKHIPQKGERSYECQLMCVLEGIRNLEYTVNGIEDRDLVYDKKSDYPDTRKEHQ